MKQHPCQLELLAPARDADTAIAAINHGADAVYMGAEAFGARAAAGNSVEDVARVAEYAHRFGARVYVTVNTIIFEDELEKVEQLIWQLWRAGADALIVQDMALLEMRLPPIELHASTQTDARTPEKVATMVKAGFSQVVVPREFSLDEISRSAAAAAEAGGRIEAFVHGALCVSYSGDCHAGALLAGRSANRGECPQVCRLKFTLTGDDGKPVDVPDGGNASRYWLSLADMNRIDNLGDMADAGVSSFKIEGRLKSESYVKNVVGAYSKALDMVVEASGGRYCRSSYGRVKYTFSPNPVATFNRGFTRYFLTDKTADQTAVSSWRSPKWTGRSIGTVTAVGKGFLRLKLNSGILLKNGDGLGFFNSRDEFDGVRANRIEGTTVWLPAGAKPDVKPGCEVFRNTDTEFENKVGRADSARRAIDVDICLRHLPDGRIAAEASDIRGARACVTTDKTYTDRARTPQQQARGDIMGRTGTTIYDVASLDDRLGDLFVPSKDLTALRRNLFSALDADFAIRRRIPLRKNSELQPDAFAGLRLDYHANVANSLSKEFYTSHGAEVAENAVEVEASGGEKRVMTTRYCLRRSLGCCLKTPRGSLLPRRLWLDAPIGRLRVEFDCENCNMKLYTNPKYITHGKN